MPVTYKKIEEAKPITSTKEERRQENINIIFL